MPEAPLHLCQLCPHKSCDMVTHLSVWDGHPAQGLVQGMGDTQDLGRSCWGVPPVQPREEKLWGSGVAPPRVCGAMGPWGCWAPRLE